MTDQPVKMPSSTPQEKKDEVDFGNPLEEEKLLLSWKAPERLHKRHSKEFFSTVGAFVFLLSIITVFFKEFFLMITIWAMAFLSLVMSRTEPEMTEHALTTRGVKTGKNKYHWGELARFWFEEKWGKTILYIDTFRAFPGRLMMVLGDIPKEKVKAIFVKKIPYDKPEETFIDHATKWFQEKVPLEEETMAKKQETVIKKDQPNTAPAASR